MRGKGILGWWIGGKIINCGLFPVIAFCALLLIACDQPVPKQSSPVLAAASSPRPLNEAEVRQKYRNCSDGYYSGPQPGKTRYTKDDYYWVVTPEFAKRYCMPPEFVDTQLKGALAIAYKPVQEGAENCGFGGNKEACSRRTAHGFEIYFDSAIPIEHVSDTKYNYRAFYMLPHSKHLIGPNDDQIQTPQQRKLWEQDRPGAQSRFKVPGWGIGEANHGKMLWSFVPCGEVQYIDNILPGINFLSLECSMGDFNNPRRPIEKGMKYMLELTKLHDEDRDNKPLEEYAYLITLPDRLAQRVEAVDKQGAEAFNRLLHQALPEAYGK